MTICREPINLERSEVESILPHRGSALFVQSAKISGTTVAGECMWTATHPHLLGHFPDNPIVPGVFLIEAGAQLAGLCIAVNRMSAPGLGMLAGVRRVLIHGPVRPDDTLEFQLEVASSASAMFEAKGGAHFKDGRKAVTLHVLIAVRGLESQQPTHLSV